MYRGKEIRQDSPLVMYTAEDIQKIYKQHHYKCGTVLYSEDGGYEWHSVPIDSGKWKSSLWIFAIIGDEV